MGNNLTRDSLSKVNLFSPATLRRGVLRASAPREGHRLSARAVRGASRARSEETRRRLGGIVWRPERRAGQSRSQRAASWRERGMRAEDTGWSGGGMECGGVPCGCARLATAAASVRSRHRPAASPAVGWAAREARV